MILHPELAVSATRSEDGFSTFLGPRDRHAVAIPFRKRKTDNPKGCISLKRAAYEDLADSVLSSRGWIFQERILPW
jgi:hypothetical protein